MELLTQTEGLAFYWFLKNKPEFFTGKLTFNVLGAATSLGAKTVVDLLVAYEKIGAVTFQDFQILKESYLTAYATERDTVVKPLTHKLLVSMSSGGSLSESEKLRINGYMSDPHKGLTGDQFKELEQEGKLPVNFESNWFSQLREASHQTILSGVNFTLIVNSAAIEKIMGDYFELFRQDEGGDPTDTLESLSFAYTKQRWDISVFIADLILNGHKRTALKLSAAEMWPEGTKVALHGSARGEAIYRYRLPQALFAMESEGFLKVRGFNYPDRSQQVVITSRIIWHHPVELVVSVQPAWIEWYSQEVNNQKNNTTQPATPQFYFSDGILHRDGFSGVLKFKENTLEYNLLAVAFENPIGKRLDTAVRSIDATDFKVLADTARRINEKNKMAFNLDSDFFLIENDKKAVYRAIK